MIKYLPLEFVTALNVRHCSDSTGLLDADGAAGAIGRPQHSYEGEDLFPTIWMKAAALLHGIAGSQYWANGNKRTAYLATQAFLRINGAPLKELPVIDRLAFVAAVAQNVLELHQIAEWLKTNRLRAADRLEFALLAASANFDEESDGVWSGSLCSASMLIVDEVPAQGWVHFVQRIRWTPFDVGVRQRVTTTLHTVDGLSGDAAALATLTAEHVVEDIDVVKSGHRNHKHGIMPTVLIQALPLAILREGRIRVVSHLNGEPLAGLPLDIKLGGGLFNPPESLLNLQTLWLQTPPQQD